MNIKDGVVTMTVSEYDDFLDAYMLLNSLRNAGVDNWCGWDDGREEYFAWKEGK